MRRTYSFELIAKNQLTQRLSFRSLNDIRRFTASSSIVSARSTKSVPPLPCFNYKVKLKLLAVNMLIKKLINRIMFLEDIERSKLGKFIHMECPEQILSWRFEDWLETASNRVLWFKVIQRQMSHTQFAVWMHLKNYTAMRNFLYDLTDSYVHRNTNVTPRDIMASVSKFHRFDTEISKEAQENKATTGNLRSQLIALKFIKRTLGSLMKKPEDRFLISNIENSYVLRYSKVREQQAEMHIYYAEERLTKEIGRLRKRCDEEQFATTCTTDTYFNQIANLRERIAKLTLRYDIESTRLDGNLNYLRNAIEKIQTTRSYLEEQIEWFKEDARLSNAGLSPPPRRSTLKPVIKNLQFNKERKLALLRHQRSLTSINSQTKKALRPRTRPKKHQTRFTGSKNYSEKLGECLVENVGENLRESLGEDHVENLEENHV